MNITGTHLNYYLVCLRKLWLFSNGISMEQNSELVLEGKVIHESAYPQRSEKYEEILLEGIRVDFYDPIKKVIHEIKKSDKIEHAHILQLKYYLYIFEQHGIEAFKGVLEYPLLRKTIEILLTEEDRQEIVKVINQIEQIVQSTTCPERIIRTRCKGCSYFDFCYSGEE